MTELALGSLKPVTPPPRRSIAVSKLRRVRRAWLQEERRQNLAGAEAARLLRHLDHLGCLVEDEVYLLAAIVPHGEDVLALEVGCLNQSRSLRLLRWVSLLKSVRG